MIKNNKYKILTPTTLVIFGATGDLVRRKLTAALLNLYCNGFMPDIFQIIGFSRRDYTDEQYRNFLIKEAIKDIDIKYLKEDLTGFLNKIIYQKGFFGDINAYKNIRRKLNENGNVLNMCANKLYYLAVPPNFYLEILNNLSDSGLTLSCSDEAGWTRILIEKPFGRDINTAMKLDDILAKLFKEEQIYRIDHYLAKDTIRNIIFFRFSNVIFEPLWNSKFIEKVEIKLLEKEDVENRGSYYDSIGALRDVGQNHLLQMLALVTMECPESLSAGSIRKKRAEVFNSIMPINTKKLVNQFVIRGQYKGYRNIKGVSPDSNTETYFKIKSFLKNSRWGNVPFYLESGKALKERRIEIVIYFRKASKLVCPDSYKNHYYRNIFTIKIYPEEGIFIRFWVKKPGLLQDLEYRDFVFNYNRGMKIKAGEYEKVLLDCFSGDQTLFTSTEEIRYTWRFITPVLNNWDGNELYIYKKGSVGPEVSI